MTCSPESLAVAEVALGAANDALAEDPVIIDVTDHLPFSDVFLIITADNPRRMKAVSERVEASLQKELRVRATNIEGDAASDWMLMDFGEVVVHVFLPEAREFYSLEKLWGHSPRIQLTTTSA